VSIYGDKFSDVFATISLSHNLFSKSKKGNEFWTFIQTFINVQKRKPKKSLEKEVFFEGF